MGHCEAAQAPRKDWDYQHFGVVIGSNKKAETIQLPSYQEGELTNI